MGPSSHFASTPGRVSSVTGYIIERETSTQLRFVDTWSVGISSTKTVLPSKSRRPSSVNLCFPSRQAATSRRFAVE